MLWKTSRRQRVIDLAADKYLGFNCRHFTELLTEREGIVLSRSTVRSILLGAGLPSPRKRRPPIHRSRRERYPQEGMLLQIDGSPHDWLEGRGPRMSLAGAVDDATGKVPHAVFRADEDAEGYFLLLRGVVERRGIPLALYHDRHAVFQVLPEKEPSLQDQLEGREPHTQFGRLMMELGITSIAAHSPQAKGRVERLWGTFQDRLVSELRLAGVGTMEEANRFLEDFLPRYNERFGTTPRQDGSAYRAVGQLNLDTVFCFKYPRVVGADNVVRFRGERLQILPSSDRQSFARCSVEVHEQMDGTHRVCYQGCYLDIRPAPKEAAGARQITGTASHSPAPGPGASIPAKDHPWRRWVYRAPRQEQGMVTESLGN